METFWDTLTPNRQFGLRPSAATEVSSAVPIPSVGRSAGPGVDGGSASPWHPDNALFWFGALALVTLGLIAGSTSIRIGPLKASASAGK